VGQADKPADTRAPETIEDEIEATRQRLAVTIDQLVHRASPKTILRREIDNVKAFFVDADGAPRIDNLAKVAGAVVGAATLVVVLRKVTK